MALMKCNREQSAMPGWCSGIGTKLVTVVVLCSAIRILVAQAPPPAETLVREDTDQQGFKIQLPAESLRKNKTLVGKEQASVRKVLTGESSLTNPADRTRFLAYFTSYLFPMMTTEEGLKDIAQNRQRMLTDLMASKSPDAHREVVNQTLNSMSKIVQDGDYRPAARYNAMLIISNLNDVEPNNTGTSQTLPEPMRTALPFILQQFQKTDRDEIKLAALLGLSRHLEWENFKQPPSTPMQPANKAAAIKALSDMAGEKTVPSGRDSDVHNWMRRRAIEGLAQFCSNKADAEIAALMDRLLRDEEDALNVRLAAAMAFGKMSLQAPAKIDAVATAKELGYLALVACDAELTRAEAARKAEFEHEARLTGTYSGGGESGSYGTPGAMPMPGMMGTGGGSPDGGYGGAGSGLRQPLRPTPGIGGLGSAMPGTEGGYGGIGGEYGGVIDPSQQDPKHFRVEYLRRKLRQYVYAAQFGMLGGEDRAPPKQGAGGGTPTTPTNTANQPGGNQPAEKKGVQVAAKPGQEKKDVDEVYFKVRKVAEAIEGAGDKALFHELVKDVRKQLTPLEAITKRLPPAGSAAPGSVIDEDAPSTALAPGKGPAAKGKAAPKGPPRPVVPGKSASRPAVKPQPTVFGKPSR